MNTIYIIKVLSIGLFRAGGYYFFIAFLFLYFPMPIFWYIRSRALTWVNKKSKKSSKFAPWAWRTVRFVLISLMLMTWWGIFAGFCICLHHVLSHYLPEAGHQYWVCYSIAVTLPALWALIRFIRFFTISKEEKDLPTLEVEDKRPLFNQMIRQ